MSFLHESNLLIMEDFWKGVPREKKILIEEKMSKWAKMTLDELREIFHSQNSKKLRGVPNMLIFKFRFSDDYRIAYTYASELVHLSKLDNLNNLYIREDDLDKVVFLYATEHNKQGHVAKRRVNWVRPVMKYGETKESVSYKPYLSKVQNKCLNSDFPLLVFAGAGSGKTTIAVRKMQMEMERAGEEEKAVYVAISERLVKENRLNEGESNGGKTEFCTLSELCKTLLKPTEGDIDAITFDEFNRDFFIPNVKSNLTALELWTEIRGVIKGYMGNVWRRNLFEKHYQFDTGFVKFVDGIDKAKWERGKGKQEAYISLPYGMNVNDWCKIVKHDDSFNFSYEKYLQEVREYFENASNWNDEITFEEYENLDCENLDTMSSRYEQPEKKKIYELYKKYKKWLNENGRLDDNDLAKKVLANGIREKYSLIVVDEAQDFTQLQTFMLFTLIKPEKYQIAKNAEEKSIYKMIFAGDVHQTIHPTYFSPQQLRQLFYMHGIEANVSSLPESHRSYSEVLKVAYKLSNIRREKIGRLDGATEVMPDAMRNGGKAFTLKNDTSYLKSIVESLHMVPDHGVIVPNEAEREKFKSEFILDGKQVNVFTVEEMKGLELGFVICFNIISAYADEWREIMTQTVKKMAHYRLYFNLLYVAIMRAIMYVCIYEETYRDLELRPIIDFFDYVEKDHFDKEILLDISAANPEDWREAACKYEKAEKYEEAINNYERADLNDNCLEILRCKALLEEKKGNYTKAAEFYCEIGDLNVDNSEKLCGFEAAYRVSKKTGDESFEIYMFLLLERSLLEIDKGVQQEKIISAIRTHGGKSDKANDKLHTSLSLALSQISNEFEKNVNPTFE